MPPNTRLWTIFVQCFFRDAARPLEWFNLLALLYCARVLFAVPDIFTRPAYSAFAGEPEFWATIMLAVVITQLVAMRPLRHAPVLRFLAMAVAAGLWTILKLQTDQYEDLALRVGQASDTVAAGAGQMTAAGVAAETINASIADIGRAATAANAEFSDMAGVATSVMQTLKVPASELRDSLGALVTAGKLGAFELKDMATYFPQLTSGVAKFGVKGREAVNFLATGLQIAKKGASDPSTAANNLNNFLAKALAPTTIKNFQDMGVDIEAVMKDAASKGINPLEAMLQKIMKLTSVSDKDIASFMAKAKARGLEGAEALGYVREQLEAIGAAGKIGNLFGDMQVMDFLIPMMANVDEFKDIKRQVAEATGAAIDADFETQMLGLNRQLIRFGEIGTQAVRFVGLAFGQWLPMMGDRAESLLRRLRELDATTGGMVSQGLVLAGGVILLVGALGALGLALPVVGAGLSALGALAALVLSPIGVVLAAIAGGAALVWQNWDRIGPRVGRIFDRLKTHALAAGRQVMAAGRSLIASGRDLVSRYGPAVTAGVGDAWSRASALGRRAITAIRDSAGEFLKGTGWTGADVATTALDLFTAALGRLRAMVDGGMANVRFVLGTLGEFLAGFATQLQPMGASFSGVVTAFGNLGRALGGLVDAIRDIAGIAPIDWAGIFGDAANFLGRTLGQAFTLFGHALKFVIEQVTAAVNWLRDLAQSIASLDGGLVMQFGEAIRSGFAGIAGLVQGVANAINAVVQAAERLPANPLKGLAAPGLASGGATGVRPSGMDIIGQGLRDSLRIMPPANTNQPAPTTGEKQSALPGRTKVAALEPAVRQRVDAGGTIRIQVEGPGKVVGTEANDKRIAMAIDRGRSVGRA